MPAANRMGMRIYTLVSAGLAVAAAAALALGQTPEPTYTLTFPDGTSARATLGVRYNSDGAVDAATVTIARSGSERRDQSRVTGEEAARAPGVLTPARLFVTETWESGESALDVGAKRAMVLSGFTKSGEAVSLERTPDDLKSTNRTYSLSGKISRWKFMTDGRRLVSMTGDHGVAIKRD